jgi:cyclopropane fatty-acyl-phospholipid synthase-like methyltransferase
MKLGSLPQRLSRWLRPADGRDGVDRSTPPRDPRLDELAILLLLQRKWSYLRYVHLREGLLAAGPVDSVLAIGAGRGLAELALAVEFPKTRFVLTDVASERTPNYQLAQDRARTWKLPNVEFGILDVTRPIEDRYDLVASIEVVEHIEDDETAIAHMRAAARRFVFCLAPYADDATLADPRQQRRAWARHQHHRFGYSPERFRSLFDDVAAMRGCYFRDTGHALRLAVDALDDDTIRARAAELAAAARADVIDVLPTPPSAPGEPAVAQGIWVLARVPEAATTVPSGPGPASVEDPERALQETRLREVRRRLVFYRSWSYFRYLHLRQAFLSTRGISSVLSIGSGRGLAELALAVEFPEVRFQLSDVPSPHASSSDPVLALAKKWGLSNLSRTSLDVLEPLPERYDLVASVEVLEHIEDDARAAANMTDAARLYTFCLVPYADARTAADPIRRKRAWEKDHHYRFGYPVEALRSLFPGETAIVRGCYWQEAGARVVEALKDLSDDALLARAPIVWQEAECDLIDRVPQRYPEALGVWILSRREPRTDD